jgi:hypothetical protein
MKYPPKFYMYSWYIIVLTWVNAYRYHDNSSSQSELAQHFTLRIEVVTSWLLSLKLEKIVSGSENIHFNTRNPSNLVKIKQSHVLLLSVCHRMQRERKWFESDEAEWRRHHHLDNMRWVEGRGVSAALKYGITREFYSCYVLYRISHCSYIMDILSFQHFYVWDRLSLDCYSRIHGISSYFYRSYTVYCIGTLISCNLYPATWDFRPFLLFRIPVRECARTLWIG